MYGETGRMVPRAAHPHGEDFVRAKVRQLGWLTGGLPGVTWSIIACDDGCQDQPSSADLMTHIAAAEGYPGEGHRSVTVLRLADVIGRDISISPAFDRLTSTEQSRKGGSILVGMAAAVRADPAERTAPAGMWSATPTPTSREPGPARLLAAPIVAGDKVAARSASVTGSRGRYWSGPTGRSPSRTAPAASRTRSSSCSAISSGPCSSHPWPTCSIPRPASRPSTGPRSARPSGR